ncbi:monocarboxylate transporter 4-like isoform X2 [Palaemon carinicauda]|uniref:monocarboxylate transporter 4-like isoform X2 n=1 Tax=Palaemon carinicauda TaxID=392227 RepID=UPI0035B65B77
MTLGYILPSELTLLQRFWNNWITKELWNVWNINEHGKKRENSTTKDDNVPIEQSSGETNFPRIDVTDHGVVSAEVNIILNKSLPERIIMEDINLETYELKGTLKIEPLDTSKIEPLDTSKIEPLDTSKIEPLDTSKIEPLDTSKIEPLDTSKIEPLDTSKIEPLDTSKIEPLDTSKIEPLDTSKIEPLDTSKIEPLDTSKIEPLDTSKIEPLDTSKIEPLDTSKIEPLDTSKIEPLDTSKIEPLDTSKIEPLDTSKIEPLDTSKIEPPGDERDFGLVPGSVCLEDLNVLFPRSVKDDNDLEACEKNGVESSESKRPGEEYDVPDGGWGWFIVCANAICAMMFTTQGPCFGLFFGPRLRELGATATLTSWIFNFQSLTRNLTGPWTGLLGSKFGYRPVAMIAAFMAALSFIVSSANFCNPMYFLMTFSLLSGVGGGLCINSCYHMSAKYFKKRLGLANGIMVTGGSLGFIVMPILGAKLHEHFSFQWTTIIAGCVLMLAVPGTAFFQPLEWYMKRKSAGQDQEKVQTTAISDQEKEEGLLKKFLNQFKPSVLRDPLVLTTALYTGLSITTLLNIVSTVPFLLNDAGYNLKDSSWPVSVAAFADLGTRVLCASVVDFPWLNVRLLYAVAQIIAILAPNALMLGTHNYTMVLLTMGSVGIGLGIMYVLDVYIIIRVLGVERMQSVYGISQLLRAMSYCLIGPMGGVLRQATGSYRASIILYTCTISVGLLLLVSTCIYTEFWPMKKDKKSDKENTDKI